MQKSKKQLLGVIGLGVVTAITAVAIALPTPDVNAFGTNINLKVQVYSQTPSIVIQSPSDGSEFTNNNIQISNVYSKTSTIHYQLTHIDNSGVRTDYTLPDYVAATTGTADGVHNWSLNLNNYGGGQYGQYILTSTVGAVSDYVSFNYNSIRVDNNITVDPASGDPIITVDYNDEICSLRIQAYDIAGQALFNPEYVYTVPTPRPSPSTAYITLPFSQYNVNAGSYRIVVKGYGCGNNQNNQVGNEDDTNINNYQPQNNITTDPNGDPIVTIRYDFNVELCSINFQAFHKTTNAALFHPEYEQKITPPSKNGLVQVTLPFAQYGAESGDYLITATFYDCNGNQIGNTDYDFNGYVKPVAPGVPDTGGGFFAGLNFSRKDYLVTGVVTFMIALAIAIRVMAKSRKSGRR